MYVYYDRYSMAGMRAKWITKLVSNKAKLVQNISRFFIERQNNNSYRYYIKLYIFYCGGGDDIL